MGLLVSARNAPSKVSSCMLRVVSRMNLLTRSPHCEVRNSVIAICGASEKSKKSFATVSGCSTQRKSALLRQMHQSTSAPAQNALPSCSLKGRQMVSRRRCWKHGGPTAKMPVQCLSGAMTRTSPRKWGPGVSESRRSAEIALTPWARRASRSAPENSKRTR